MVGKHRKDKPDPRKPQPVPDIPLKFKCLVCGREYKEIQDAVNCKHR